MSISLASFLLPHFSTPRPSAPTEGPQVNPREILAQVRLEGPPTLRLAPETQAGQQGSAPRACLEVLLLNVSPLSPLTLDKALGGG